ncbi:MAG: NAD(P)/FAD-dependent oxidoreductase [Clostridiaceae bacterium]|jgi:flavin-dependent dehydrogenase|nr:NAD(P)/FAD-dependent oxidoreductase [Clostridiaceae bacterium]
MKIIIIGAGQGGLSAAYGLAKGGHDVVVYEARKEDELIYDWHDDVNCKVFKDLKIPVPDESEYFLKNYWSFNGPFSDRWVKVIQDPEKLDWSMERRPLSRILTARAREAGAVIKFETPVEKLVFGEESVKGATVYGEDILAALVIDSSGVFSKFRASLPASFGIAKQPGKEDVFEVYRAFYNMKPDTKTPSLHTNKAYLKHLGRNGISWCIADPSGQVNVLVGTVGELTDKDFAAAMEHLKKDNDFLGDILLRGGSICNIPVRYPITKMVADGYALIGDAAFMTIPMLGSGIASSIYAGDILAEVVNRKNSARAADLWEYQCKFMRKLGAVHVAVDVLKRWMLTADNDDVRYLMESGIVSENDMKYVSVGEMLVLKPVDLIKKLLIGWKKLPLLLTLNKVLMKGKKGYKLAMKIPVTYKPAKVAAWERKLNGLFETKR